MIGNQKEEKFKAGDDIKEVKLDHHLEDVNENQNAFNILFIRLGQTEDNDQRMQIIQFMIDNMGGKDVELNDFQIQTLFHLFNVEICDDEEIQSSAAMLLNVIFYIDIERYSTIYLRSGFMEIAKEYFVTYPDITAITASLLFSSFDACNIFVESGLIETLREEILAYNESLKHLIRCVQGISHFSAFEDQIAPFVNILYSILQMPENVNEYFQAILYAFSAMATYSEELAKLIVAHSGFPSLLQQCLAILECEEEDGEGKSATSPSKLIMDSFISFAGGILSRSGIINDDLISQLIVRVCNLYKSTDIFFVKHALEALTKGCHLGPNFVQICIDNDIHIHASLIMRNENITFNDLELNAKLLFSLFINSSQEQFDAFYNEPVGVAELAFKVLQTAEKAIPDILLMTFIHLLEVAEATSNQELIEAIVESEEINEFIALLVDSEDKDLAYKAESLKELIEGE